MSPTDVDEDVIIAVLVKRSNEQRQKIKVVYETSTGKVSDSKICNKLNASQTLTPKHTEAHVK